METLVCLHRNSWDWKNAEKPMPSRIRTHDHTVRSRAFYPTELLALRLVLALRNAAVPVSCCGYLLSLLLLGSKSFVCLFQKGFLLLSCRRLEFSEREGLTWRTVAMVSKRHAQQNHPAYFRLGFLVSRCIRHD